MTTRSIDIIPGRDVGHMAGPFPSDFPIADGDYVGYFCNAYGEELVFVQRKGEATAVLLHSDCDWDFSAWVRHTACTIRCHLSRPDVMSAPRIGVQHASATKPPPGRSLQLLD